MSSQVKIGWAARDVSTTARVNIPGQMHMRISEGVQDPVTVTALAVERMDLLALVAESFFPAYNEALEQFRERCQLLNIWQTPPQPILQGRHLIACGIRPGKNMGKILEKCFDAQLDGAFADEDGALAFLRSMNPLPED